MGKRSIYFSRSQGRRTEEDLVWEIIRVRGAEDAHRLCAGLQQRARARIPEGELHDVAGCGPHQRRDDRGDEQRHEADMLKTPLALGPETARVPDGPGLGVDLDEEQVEKYRDHSGQAGAMGNTTGLTFEG